MRAAPDRVKSDESRSPDAAPRRDSPTVTGVPKDMQRLATEVDGWLDLRCPDKALEKLQPMLDRPDARSEGLALRVRAYVALKKHKPALADIHELREASYDPEWLDLTEAWCKKRVQDLPGAIECMGRLLQRNAGSAIGHFNLGCYLALVGEREQALDEVTLACGLDTSFRELLFSEPDLETLFKDPRFVALAGTSGAAGEDADEPPFDDDEDDEDFDDLEDEDEDFDDDDDGDGNDEGEEDDEEQDTRR